MKSSSDTESNSGDIPNRKLNSDGNENRNLEREVRNEADKNKPIILVVEDSGEVRKEEAKNSSPTEEVLGIKTHVVVNPIKKEHPNKSMSMIRLEHRGKDNSNNLLAVV